MVDKELMATRQVIFSDNLHACICQPGFRIIPLNLYIFPFRAPLVIPDLVASPVTLVPP